jgi:hypothetical protein
MTPLHAFIFLGFCFGLIALGGVGGYLQAEMETWPAFMEGDKTPTIVLDGKDFHPNINYNPGCVHDFAWIYEMDPFEGIMMYRKVCKNCPYVAWKSDQPPANVS